MNYYLKITLLGFRNLQKFTIELFKAKLGIAPEIMKNIFPIIENPCDLETKPILSLELSTVFDMALKLLLFLHQEFGAAFQEVFKECSSLNLVSRFLGGEFFVWRTFSADFWSICLWICRDCAFLLFLFYLFIYLFFDGDFLARGLGGVSVFCAA